MSSARIDLFGVPEIRPTEKPNIFWPQSVDSSEEDQDMGIRRSTHETQALDESIENLMRMVAQSQMRTDERIAVAMETRAMNATDSALDKFLKWVSPLMMMGVLIVTTTRSYSTSEATLSQQVAEAKSAIARAEERAKQAQTNVLMLDTYNRELERALIKQGKVNLPPYPQLDR